MAYGRVNILGQGGMENIKTIDSGKEGTLALIDFKRQRKIFESDNKIYDFNDNVIAEMDSGYYKSHVGFVGGYGGTLYNLTTGKQVTAPEGFRYDGGDFILNEEMDYYRNSSRGEIRDKEGNVLYESIKNIWTKVLYIQNDVVYFHTRGGRIYRYKDRRLLLIADVNLDEIAGWESVNFL